MKKSLILLAGILVACLPGMIMAGINPANVGLVPVNTSSAFPANDNNYYPQGLGANITSNGGSVLCVACHTRNPANLAGSTKNVSRSMAGSHFVTRNFNDTSRGGGYADGRGQRNASGTHIYMAKAPINWAAPPRYGRLTAGAIDNADLIGDSAPANLDGAQMICYSCHNLRYNTGTAARLLAGGQPALSPFNTITGTAPFVDNAYLCISCHGDMDAVIAAEWQIHPVDNTIGETWGATHHHRNSHSTDAVTNAAYKGTATPLAFAATCPSSGQSHNMGLMCDFFYNQPTGAGGALWQLWAINRGNLGTSANANHAIGFNTASGRTLTAAPDNGWIRPNNHAGATGVGQGLIMCTDCHRGHFGDSSTGATVLLKGGAAAGPSNPFTTSMGSGTNPIPDANNGWRAVQRLNDQGGRGSVFSITYANLNPNCLVCHR